MAKQEEELSKEELKEQKRREKEEKKALKKNKNGGNEDDDDDDKESTGSKIIVVFVTLLIIAVWLAIIALLIKLDVGGVGSSVLRPLLKDVPVISSILPDEKEEDTANNDAKNQDYPYDTLDEAIEQIKTLELELQKSQESSGNNDSQISDLQKQIKKLQKYKNEQEEFEKEKEKFDQEVVFSDNAPDINTYKEYYESIDPDNAEKLYKQVVEQQQADKEVEDYVKTYSAMKAKNAAAIFETMTDDMDLVVEILQNMDVEVRSGIISAMNAQTAAQITQRLAPDKLGSTGNTDSN